VYARKISAYISCVIASFVLIHCVIETCKYTTLSSQGKVASLCNNLILFKFCSGICYCLYFQDLSTF